MLSKSQARLFFLIATLGFSGVFLWLTIDTMSQLGERSHADRITPEVVRGKEIWEANNCMGCHTLFGEGAYYAPELTKVVQRRGKEWMRVFLKDPQAMYPGRRKMVQYDFTDAQIEDVISFFDWVGKVDTNGFPRDPDMRPRAATATAQASSGPPAPAIFSTICTSCHSYGGQGGNVGPALDTVGDRYDAAALRTWLSDPQAVKPGTAMPNLHLDEQQLADLGRFLMASRAQKEN